MAGADSFTQIAALRYEVYCLECGFLSPEAYPGKLEVDDYDGRSLHVAAFDPEGQLVGAVRLVLAGARVAESPIIFLERRAGQSKLHRSEIWRGALALLRMRWALRGAARRAAA